MAPLMGMPLGWGPICGSQAVLEVEEVEAAKKKKKKWWRQPPARKHPCTPRHRALQRGDQGQRALTTGPSRLRRES